MTSLPGERALRPGHMSMLRQLIRDHQFYSPTWSKSIDTNTGAEYRADGQHSSRMLMELSDEQFPTGLRVNIQTWTFDTDADKSELFAKFDPQWSTRTAEDYMNHYKDSHPDLQKISPRFLLTVSAGWFAYYREIEKGELYGAKYRGIYLNDPTRREFVKWLYPFYGWAGTMYKEAQLPARHAWMLRKPGIVAEIFTDWLRDRDTAEEFWTYAFNGNHPDPEDFTREMVEQLKAWADNKRSSRSIKQYRNTAAKFWRQFCRARKPRFSEAA